MMNKAMQLSKEQTHPHIEIMLFLFFHCLLLLAFAITLSSPRQLLTGLFNIMTSSSLLITDYAYIGGIGSAFFNSFLVTSLYLLLIFRRKISLDFSFIATIFTIAGFSFFGKNLFNTLPLILGNYLYTKLVKKSCPQTINSAIFSSAVAPVVSFIAFGLGLPSFLGVFIGSLIGIFLGLIFPLISIHVRGIHQGLNLFNGGFAAGILAMAIYGFLSLFYVFPEKNTVTYLEFQHIFKIYWVFFLLSLLVLMVIFLFYRSIDSKSAYHQPSFINCYQVAIIALFYSGYLITIDAPFNGFVFGSLLTVIGFCFSGITLKDLFPPFLGVLVIQILSPENLINSQEIVSLVLFSIGLSPLTKQKGQLLGFFSGILLALFAPLAFQLHGGLNLYNSGFACGFVVTLCLGIQQKHHSSTIQKSTKKSI